jgi:hypothetical protein
VEHQGAFEHVNDSIRTLASEGSAAQTWDFFCECQDDGCHTIVSLTLPEFDERRAAEPPLPVIARHHEAA